MAETAPARKRIGFIVRILVSVCLLAFVLRQVGPGKVWEAVLHSNIPRLLAFSPLPVLMGLIGVLRWRLLLGCQEIDITFWEATKLTLVGFFFCNFLPGLAGDVVKAVYAARHTPHKTRLALSIVVDRLIGMDAMGIVVLVALLTCADKEMALRGMPVIIGLLAICVIATFIFLWGRTLGLDRLARRFPLRGVSEELVKASDSYANSRGTLLAALLLSFLPHFGTIILFYGYGTALGIDQMTFADYVFGVPMVVFIGAIPVTIMMGLGTGELSAAWLFAAKGVPSGLAVALSLIQRATIVLWSLPGGVIALFYRTHPKSG